MHSFGLVGLLSGFRVTRDGTNDQSSRLRVDRAEHDAAGHEVLLGPPSHPEMLGRLGRYEIERVIGCGGMGVVFKAIDTELNRPVAIKVLAPHLARKGASVPWTKPEDVQFEPNNSLAKLAPSRLVAMCDGAVRTLPAKITEQLLAIFATRAGGEPTPE